MAYIDIIKTGITQANRSWPLLIVQFVAGVLTVLAAFVLVGIPLIAGIVMVGVSASQVGDVETFLEGNNIDPTALIGQYMGLIIVIVIGFLFYMIFAFIFGAYVQGGVAASIGRTALKPAFKFDLKVFFRDARKFLKPVILYNLLIALLFLGLGVLLVLGIFGIGALGGIVAGIEGGQGFLGDVLKWFIYLVLGSFGILGIAAAMGLSLQGLAPLIMRGMGPMESIKEAVDFWERDRQSLIMLAIVIAGVILVQGCVVVLGMLIQLIPILGPLINIPYRFAANIFQMYLWLVAMSVVFNYYVQKNRRPALARPATPAPASRPSGAGSSLPESTSPGPVPGPGDALPPEAPQQP